MHDTTDRARAQVRSGHAALEARDLLGAAQQFMAALELNPRDPQAWYGQGLVMLQLGQPGPAREAFSQANALDPSLIPRRPPAPDLPWGLPPRGPRPDAPRTVAGALARLTTQTDLALALAHPGRPAVVVSGTDLARRSHAWAAHLAPHPDPIVPIFGRTTPEMIAAYLGAILAGKLPTFLAYPSTKIHRDHFGSLLRHHARQLGTQRFVGEAIDRDIGPDVTCPGDVPDAPFSAPDPRPPDAPLFLQCSSGTTGRQKVVEITSRQLEHQLSATAEAFTVDPRRDVVASWLPLYHDMGLVATLWLPLVMDLPVVYLDPFEWAAQPSFLYQVITATRATLVWQPNFAFSLACRAPLHTDLSSVRAFVSCAEPISPAGIDRFCRTLDVRPDQICHSYALAENVFGATQTPLGRPDNAARFDADALAHGSVVPGGDAVLASVGVPLRGVEVRIDAADPDTVGEVLLRGSSTVPSYRGQPPPRSDGWFPTGDLGFVHDGELFVTGRLQDRIVHNGRNLHPHDLEEVVFDHPRVHPGRGMAVGDYDEASGTEQVRVLFEPEGDPSGVADDLTRALDGRFSVRPRVHAVPRGWLRKTSSGKIARRENRRRFHEQRARTLHIVGDSHVRIWWRRPQQPHYAGVQAHWLGVLWGDSWRTKFTAIVDVCRDLRREDVLVIATGEPECRTVFAGADDPEARIRASVDSYRRLFETVCKGRPDGGVAYMTGIPTRTHEVPQVRDDWRIVGDLEARLAHQRDFYAQMAALCDEMDLPFVDVCTPLQGFDGRVKDDHLHDGVHLHPRHRPELLWWTMQALGVVDDRPAAAQLPPPWDGTRAHFDLLCGEVLEGLGAGGRTSDLVSEGHLDSLALLRFVGFVEATFDVDLVLHQMARSDLDSLDRIWARFVCPPSTSPEPGS